MSKQTMKDRIEQATDLRHAARVKENAIADHDRGDITGAQKAKESTARHSRTLGRAAEHAGRGGVTNGQR